KVPPKIPPETVLIPKTEIVVAELIIVRAELLERFTTASGMIMAKLPLRIGITSNTVFILVRLNRCLSESFKFEIISENVALKSTFETLVDGVLSI
ncbi:hypothetical protein LAJ55_12205, partial [Streptococcus pneumoniae]